MEYIEDFFRAENEADGRGSFPAVERSMLDRLSGSEIYTERGGLVAQLIQRSGQWDKTSALDYGFPQRSSNRCARPQLYL